MEVKKRGVFVTVDGVDGAGKSSTCHSLAAKLSNAVYYKTPGEPFLSMAHLVNRNIIPIIRYGFYRTALQHDSAQIMQYLAAGKNVVCDRYIQSTYAYHAAVDPMIDLVFSKEGLLQPDLEILLFASSEIRQVRLSQREDMSDIQGNAKLEADVAYQDKVQDIFLNNQIMFRIDSGKTSIEQSSDLVIAELQRLKLI